LGLRGNKSPIRRDAWRADRERAGGKVARRLAARFLTYNQIN